MVAPRGCPGLPRRAATLARPDETHVTRSSAGGGESVAQRAARLRAEQARLQAELRELAALAQGLDAGERAELLAALQGAELPAEPAEPAEPARGPGGAERAGQRTAPQGAGGRAEPARSGDEKVTRAAGQPRPASVKLSAGY